MKELNTDRKIVLLRLLHTMSPSLLYKWWKEDSTLSLTPQSFHPLSILSNGKTKVGELSYELERKFPILQQTLADIKSSGIEAIPISSDEYPLWLKSIHDPPPVLFAKGKKEIMHHHPLIGIVGTRHPSPYGVKAVRSLVRDLTEEGIVIVSGLAKGIDGLAHQTAIQAGGSTIGVIAGGFHHIYPKENHQLASQMAESHLLLSEHPPYETPQKWQFPLRNRIISGLSKGIVVIQGREKSGSLITAYQALEQGREVFAVPGPIFDPCSLGPFKLIQEGAKLVVSKQDVMEELRISPVHYWEHS
ncbi:MULTISPECIES: DNA-processing protein DprA [Bacillus]|uniref:DNA repair protein Smf n=2 Tax=Bacillus TaxID=1386 RepID=A0A0M5JB91_9BACI|nr:MULTISPECIES: DNA-processing protein DprA [Bacillus]ALC81044.1 DNA repair protein Smf [Bacillus gobiensis]MBP1080003.1 DNA processing protein [Bacillus capparidis]MED1095391.1 DNA-processing protein DprA [Bacillus capparidis]